MTAPDPLDQLGRLEKLLLRTGAARCIEEARASLRRYSIQILLGPDVANSPALQAALTTAVNAARRAVHGDVVVVGADSAPLRVSIPGCDTLEAAVSLLGGTSATAPTTSPALLIGSVEIPDAPVAVQAVCRGWAGGVIPAGEELAAPPAPPNALGGVLAGAVGVSELFESLRGANVRAGRRQIGYSAWDPAANWLSSSAIGPQLEYLPSRLWVIGLGHLGQSLLWSLSMLPFATRPAVQLVLQDFDPLTRANLGTSPLSFPDNVGQLKTRVSAAWMEELGFQARLVERPFAGDFHVNDQEPRLAFCGVDNLAGRAAVEQTGFEAVVEAGLGTDEEYQAFQLHTFPGPEEAAERWRTRRSKANTELSAGLAHYAAQEGLDGCGRARLAGLQVASSFVGLAVATIAIGQMARPLHGGLMHGAISGNMASAAPPMTLPGMVGRTAVRYGSTVSAACL